MNVLRMIPPRLDPPRPIYACRRLGVICVWCSGASMEMSLGAFFFNVPQVGVAMALVSLGLAYTAWLDATSLPLVGYFQRSGDRASWRPVSQHELDPPLARLLDEEGRP